MASSQYYTLVDALEWDESERIELIYGIPVMMSPPVRIHQEIFGELFGQLRDYLKGKSVEFTLRPLPFIRSREKEINLKTSTLWWNRIFR